MTIKELMEILQDLDEEMIVAVETEEGIIKISDVDTYKNIVVLN